MRAFVIAGAAATVLGLGVWIYSCGSGDSGGTGGGADAGPDAINGADSPNGADTGSGGDSGPKPDGGVKPDSGPPPSTASVLEYHKNKSRDGLYIEPSMTKAVAATLVIDPAFTPATQGRTDGQPLFVESLTPNKDAVFVATEDNNVYAFDAASGAVLWQKTPLATPVPLGSLPCGGPTDPHGAMATPIIDMSSRTIYVEAFTTPDNGNTKVHQVFGLSIDDGSARAGWPVDIAAKINGFDATVQNDRAALGILGGTLYVPYAGLNGDCGTYHGWVVGIPLANPGAPKAWSTAANAGGIWGPGGIASDGTYVYATTGNTMGANTWGGGEAIVRFTDGPTFSNQSKDYFAPTDWQALDNSDIDIGSSGALVMDVPGATPSALVVAMGKDGKVYLVDRANLGGVANAVDTAHVANGEIKNAAVAYTTANGTYIALRGDGGGSNCPNGQSGDLIGLKVSATTPPKLSTAWCANANGLGNPIVTTTDGHANAIVWVAGAEGSNRLHGFDGDTGADIYTGGGAAEQMTTVRYWSTLIEAKGRFFVAGDGKLFAFKKP